MATLSSSLNPTWKRWFCLSVKSCMQSRLRWKEQSNSRGIKRSVKTEVPSSLNSSNSACSWRKIKTQPVIETLFENKNPFSQSMKLVQALNVDLIEWGWSTIDTNIVVWCPPGIYGDDPSKTNEAESLTHLTVANIETKSGQYCQRPIVRLMLNGTWR